MADKPIKTDANEFGSGTSKGAPGRYDSLPEPKGLLQRSKSPTGQPEKLFEPEGIASSPKKG
ncbi:hypothetical protein LCGC14_2553160 [marine sediment metagenome]|uniref:Uncharacterized protein n=1 Tax=marine sediment metagenome TaxID=412755 RepID=A0A0F9BA88_9ZZZZ